VIHVEIILSNFTVFVLAQIQKLILNVVKAAEPHTSYLPILKAVGKVYFLPKLQAVFIPLFS